MVLWPLRRQETSLIFISPGLILVASSPGSSQLFNVAFNTEKLGGAWGQGYYIRVVNQSCVTICMQDHKWLFCSYVRALAGYLKLLVLLPSVVIGSPQHTAYLE